MSGAKNSDFRNKSERTVAEGGGVGWMPGYEKKFKGRGTNTNSKRYQDNYDKIDWSKK